MKDRELAILIVDDQPDLVRSARRILRLDGYRVDTATSIAELMDRENWSDYFAILLDRRLADGTIDRFLPQLAELAPDAALIVATAYIDLDGAMAAIHNGAEDFLLKPIDPEHLRTRLRRLANQRRSEAELVRERAFAQMILDTTRDLILVLDQNGCVLRINRYFEELCGYQEEELIGKSVVESLIPEQSAERAEQDLARSYSEDYKQGSLHPIRTKAGGVREIAWWTARLRDDEGEILQLVCAGRDMTAYNELQRKLVQSERLMAIGEAMAGLAHESRNALQRSQACLDLLTDQLAGRPESLELLDSIQRSQDDLYRLYEEVRAFAAPIQIKPQLCDVGKVLHRAWEDVQTVHGHRNVRFSERVECDDLHCEVDAFAIGQVFRNILENALQACTDPVEVHIEYAEVDGFGCPAISVSLTDNGPGILPENAQQVFGSFFTTKSNGTGLGMAIAQRIIEAHRGKIAVNPECDQGAEFVVTLPRKQS